MNRLAIALPYAVAAGLAGMVGAPVASHIEGRLNPILGEFTLSDERVVDGHFCWVADWTKFRRATPLVIRYSVRYGAYGEPLPTVAFRDRRPLTNYERPPGRHHADLCIVLDPEVTPGTTIEVTNAIVYEMPHGLWTVTQHFPPVAGTAP